MRLILCSMKTVVLTSANSYQQKTKIIIFSQHISPTTKCHKLHMSSHQPLTSIGIWGCLNPLNLWYPWQPDLRNNQCFSVIREGDEYGLWCDDAIAVVVVSCECVVVSSKRPSRITVQGVARWSFWKWIVIIYMQWLWLFSVIWWWVIMICWRASDMNLSQYTSLH